MAEEPIFQETPAPGSEKEKSVKMPGIEQIKEKIESAEGLKEAAPENKEERIKQEIKGYLQNLQQMPPSPLPIASRDEAKEISKFPANQQVGALISLVFEKGLSEAISVAKAIDNPAILDEFHDLLVDRYYDELIKKKLLKSR
jgi:hypothetical protein